MVAKVHFGWLAKFSLFVLLLGAHQFEAFGHVEEIGRDLVVKVFKGAEFYPRKFGLKSNSLAILPDYEPILPRNGEWGRKREIWIVGVPTVTLWSSGVHIWSNIPHNKCIDAFEHSQNYMRLVCACKATLFPVNMCGFSGEKKRKICCCSNL